MSLSFKKFVQIIDSGDDEQISELFATSFAPNSAAKLRDEREKSSKIRAAAKNSIWDRAKQKAGEEDPKTPDDKAKLKDQVWNQARKRVQGLDRNAPEFAEE